MSMMLFRKEIRNYLGVLLVSAALFPSCATICGGSKYNAHIVVRNRPEATISYQGQQIGKGTAVVLVKRREANRFGFTVQETGCPDQQYRFKSRTFRGWALAGSIVTWTVLINGIPVLPAGLFVDLGTGAFWKPNVFEKGVTKQNYKNFKYTVDYNECKPPELKPGERLVDVVYLKNGTVVKGTIVEDRQNIQVQIRTENGDVALYPYSEVDKVTKEVTTP